MYSRKSWGGAMDPFILTKFIKPKNLKNKDDPLVSLVVFEWSDKDLIGYPLDDNVEGSVSIAMSEEPLNDRRLTRWTADVHMRPTEQEGWHLRQAGLLYPFQKRDRSLDIPNSIRGDTPQESSCRQLPRQKDRILLRWHIWLQR
jgi:hypothetical protein